MSCVENPKKRGRPSPPFSAKDCPGEIKTHNGATWQSVQRQNGQYYWKKIEGSPSKSSGRKSTSKSPAGRNSSRNSPAGRKSSMNSPAGRKSSKKKSPAGRKSVKKSTSGEKSKRVVCEEKGMLYNPETNRCIKDTPANRNKLTGAPDKKPAGRKSAKKSPTGRKSSGKKPAQSKPGHTKHSVVSCKADGKLYSPDTNRCIVDTAANRKKLAHHGKNPKSGELYNFNTGRMVKDTPSNRNKLQIPLEKSGQKYKII